MPATLQPITRARLTSLKPLQPLLQARLERVYLVGGAVRDLLLGGPPPRDLDLVVEGDVGPVLALLALPGSSAVRHARFGTASIRRGEYLIDLAESRRESYPAPGHLPVVSPAPLDEDLRRRDFTINAIAVAVGGSSAGNLAAVDHALEDLRAGRLRVLHDASFRDDPTRLWRLVRYAGRLGFTVEQHTRDLAVAGSVPQTQWSVGGARLGHELRLLAGEADPLPALLLAAELGLDRGLHPRFGVREPDIPLRALRLLGGAGNPGALVLACACLEMPTREVRPLLDRLAFPAQLRDLVTGAATRARPLAALLARAGRRSQVAAAARQVSLEAVALAGALGAEAPARDWLERLRHVTLAIGGEDLRRAGVAAGPAIGAGLDAALCARLDGELDGVPDDREAELACALRAASQYRV